jgi:hypothetical protein
MTTKESVDYLIKMYINANGTDQKLCDAIDIAVNSILTLEDIKLRLNSIMGCFGGKRKVRHFIQSYLWSSGSCELRRIDAELFDIHYSCKDCPHEFCTRNLNCTTIKTTNTEDN